MLGEIVLMLVIATICVLRESLSRWVAGAYKNQKMRKSLMLNGLRGPDLRKSLIGNELRKITKNILSPLYSFMLFVVIWLIWWDCIYFNQ